MENYTIQMENIEYKWIVWFFVVLLLLFFFVCLFVCFVLFVCLF
jgi:hypothetical protein